MEVSFGTTLLKRISRYRHGRLILGLIFIIIFVNVTHFSFYSSYISEHVPCAIADSSRNQESQQVILSLASFEKSIQRKLNEIRRDPGRYPMAVTDEIDEEIQVDLTPFMKESEDENSWANRNDLFYDPRFTLSMYLNQLKLKYEEMNEKGKREEIILPFHWADWIDLTTLNGDLSKPLDSRMNCAEVQKATYRNPDPSYFCLDNSMVLLEDVERYGFKSRSQLPGVIIYDHCSHNHRPFNDFRVLQAKSYAMTHLKKPISIILLNGDNGTYEFQVDQGANQRLASSTIVDDFAKSNRLKNLKTATLNHLKIWKELKSIIEPTNLDLDDPGREISAKIEAHKNDRTKLIEFPLTMDMFSHPMPVDEQIVQLELKRDSQGLSPREAVYYDGLKDCANYPDLEEKQEYRYFRLPVIRVGDKRNHAKDMGWHYDWRFFNGALQYNREGWTQDQLTHRANIILDRLLRTWYRFATQKGFISWIQHGPVLSWYWNGMMFPYDIDVDIQMPMSEMLRLGKDYNYTLVVEDPSEGYGKYLIDVSPYIYHRQLSRTANHIDARFIDVDSGIYIDITALSRLKSELPRGLWETGMGKLRKNKKENNGEVEIYNDRRKHFYSFDQLSPLKFSMLQGVPVFVPPKIIFKLVSEYGEGLHKYEFHGWYFISQLNLWIHKRYLIPLFKDEEITQDGKLQAEKLLDKVITMTYDQVLRLLDNEDILVEYYLTKHLTDLHSQEMKYLFTRHGGDNLWLSKDEANTKEYNELTKEFKIRKPLRKSLYYYENIERSRLAEQVNRL